ncbi:protein SCO1/2 [Thermosporothrix hazakensis]|jgi:protein SCO1/2|uniref:Protein SCO1/2 n=1 Tax=Thermosporothrix hazakensis TaxID=644383 RepID=A0A326U1C6_THEHA|nr:SCO family protein [Thermosporothrix hazakensis]PZW23948.1 protein SCO1/2 [Thermosporothrix hazakensis]GCE48453.1 hypothetical protein KTH_33220 [Thermosporothrix hazakensis]
MNWRLASRLSVITLTVLVVIVIVIVQRNASQTAGPGDTGNTNDSNLHGTSLDNKPAPGFTLTDQNGKEVKLDSFKGKPVVLTFMYTSCPDQCPAAAEKLRSAQEMLGREAQNVSMMAVSTDPKNDTVAAAKKFTNDHRLKANWHFLIGSRETLKPVWDAYHIYAETEQQTVAPQHTMGLYLIDKKGHMRTFLGSEFTPQDLVSNLQTLLQE